MKPNESLLRYVIIRKDGTRHTVRGSFLKYDAGSTMVIAVLGEQKTVVAVVNMEAVVAVCEDVEEVQP